jgi:isoleucyl-tRNA synthetase
MPRSDASRLEGLESLVAEELNVKEVSLAKGLEQLVSYAVKPNFRALGPRFGGRVRDVARILSASDAHALVADLESQGRVTIELDGEHVTLTAEELDVRIEGREGFSLARDGAYGVALDLDLDHDLIAEGVAREAVRAIQDLRKSSGLAVDDRIELWLSTEDDDVARAVEIHRDSVAGEVLARTVTRAPPPSGVARDSLSLDGATLFFGLRKASPD